ncbi:MAG: F0F1 ATP synthase subunit B [Gammaproteobacteria bacterium]|nr:F0F1 ATP synthase subunit B [Gammaproteobacteria bacterium]
MNITASLFGQIIAFVLLIWFVNKFLWGPVNGLLSDRQKRIADGLAAAEKGKHELELAEKRAHEALNEAKARASEILAQAEKRASEIVEESKGKAKEEGDRIKTAAVAEIEQEANRAKEQIRAQVGSIAVIAASKILSREVDAKAHEQLIKDLAAQI